jgi:dihydroxy-acid dehydratase
VVFDDYNDMAARIDDPELPASADSADRAAQRRPAGRAGMPEWGQLPIPRKLLQQGVRDMVRISVAARAAPATAPACCTSRPSRMWAGPLRWCETAIVIELDVAGRAGAEGRRGRARRAGARPGRPPGCASRGAASAGRST